MKFDRLALATIGTLILAVPAISVAERESKEATAIRRSLAARFPKMNVIDVKPAPIPSLYEVFTGQSIVYTDRKGDYLIQGSIIDTNNQKDLTEARINERNAIRFESLPFDLAIKVAKGTGMRKLAVFTDPDCPYCLRLEEEMQSVNNVTMYIFMFPLTQIHPNAERHAKSIWCADDRVKAWTAWMLEKKEPETKICDGDPVAGTLKLGERLNVSATPTIYFEDGSRQAGTMKATELDKRMNEAKKASELRGEGFTNVP